MVHHTPDFSQLPIAQRHREESNELEGFGRYQEAATELQQALPIFESAFGNDHPETAKVLHHLGRLKRKQGRFHEAEVLVRQALAIQEKHQGKEHPETATTLYEEVANLAHNLGVVYEAAGDFEKAELFLKRALAVYEEVSGPNHSDTTNLRNYLSYMGWKKTASELLESVWISEDNS